MIDTTRGEVFTLIAQHLLVMVPQIDFSDACCSIGVGVCVVYVRVYIKNDCLDLEDFQMCAAKMSTLKQLCVITLVAIWICSVLVA